MEYAALIFLILMSGLLFASSAFAMLKHIKSMNWPRVDCKIIKSETEGLLKWDESDNAGTNLIFEYQYKYEGRTYFGNTIRFGIPTNRSGGLSRIFALILAKKYPEERVAKVSVNPQKPQQSVLEPEEIGHLYLSFALSFIVLCISIFVFLRSYNWFN